MISNLSGWANLDKPPKVPSESELLVYINIPCWPSSKYIRSLIDDNE